MRIVGSEPQTFLGIIRRVLLPPAHVADHWIVYIAYAMPLIVVIAAIITSAIRARHDEGDVEEDEAGPEGPEAGISPAEPRDADRASP